MAQAARLSLRMQKELKLLLTDPPPGASFPFLSSASDLSSSSSSLTSIDAFIEGPEGTVYAKGVFHIKIQIPERYPFQPPSVTFATPIYHPNIDTGGRICLDILNLPPKGAWQPSLNISTVLTSIGLLLSEPNPDDGLMCEASREYKYNRQVFDQKARSMTEKYAKAEADENTGGHQSILSSSKPSLMESERVDNRVKNEVIGHTTSEKRACGTSQKLSLELLGSNLKRECDGEPTEAPNQLVCPSNSVNQMETGGQRGESNGEVNEYKMVCEKLSGTRRKLSLESFGQSQKRDADYKDKALPNTYTSALKPQCPMDCSESTSALQASYDQKNPHQDQDQDHISFSKRLSLSSKKLCQVDQTPSLRSSDTSQDIDINTQKLHITPQISLPQMYSSFPHNNSPKSPVIHQNDLQPIAEAKSVADSRYGITNTKCRKLSLVGKKLSLAAKISAPVEETDEKENMAPVHNLSLPHGNSYTLREGDYGLSNKDGSCQRSLLKPLMQLQGTNNDMKHNLKFSTDPSKSLSMSENLNCNLKLQSSCDHAEKLAGGSGIKETETEKSPVADAVIVLDSEDSDEERSESLRPKLLLARKCLGGKRRAKVS